jgi:polysaccharide export outer membrane protein
MIKLKSLLFYSVAGFLLASCISNKRIVYVQDYSKKRPSENLADTVFNAPPVDYTLRSGDILYVKSDHPTLSKSFQQLDVNYLSDSRTIQAVPALAGFLVDMDGNIDIPIVGKIFVEGQTIFEARETIEENAAKYFIDPAIRVFMMNYYVTILGEVNLPGRYQVLNHRINVFEAMGLAGDATDFASRETVKIVRNRNGKNELYSIDLTDQNLLASENFYLQPNDILMVKPQKRKKYATRDVQNFFNAVTATVSVITLYLLIQQD